MSLFVDQMIVALSDPAALRALLDPPADRARARVRGLVAAMLDTPYGAVHDVLDLTVRRLELAQPVFPAHRRRGTWQQTSPDHVRAELRWEDAEPPAPLWIDLAADVGMTLVVEHDPAEVESIAVHELVTRVRLRPPPRFDPADPAAQRRVELSVALLVRETLDVSEALRAAKLARAVLRRSVPLREPAADGTERFAPAAPVVVFPSAALGASRFTEVQLRALFASERVVTVFAEP